MCVFVVRENVSSANCKSQIILKVHLNVHGIKIQFLSKFESHFIFILPILPFSLSKNNKEGRALFPRIEYTNEWQPVRSDPLKDPTYDYMPPVLDRVRYWADGNSQKNDVLVLGVPSKKLSAMIPKDKFNYGPIKRTYYSPPYQTHFSSPHHHQQQQQYVSSNGNFFILIVRFSIGIILICNSSLNDWCHHQNRL